MQVDSKDILDIYLDKLYLKTSDRRLIDAKVRLSIKEKRIEARKITGLKDEELLDRLDFKPNDLTIEALEAFIAELRAIFWLQEFGFTNIVPLQASGDFAQPDFIASHNGRVCAVEVFCLTHQHEQQKDSVLGVYKNFDPEYSGSKFGRDFQSKANNKRRQLDSQEVGLKILLCVINSQPIIALNTKEQMEAHAEFFYKKLKWGKNYYLGLLTGFSSDVIFPKLIA